MKKVVFDRINGIFRIADGQRDADHRMIKSNWHRWWAPTAAILFIGIVIATLTLTPSEVRCHGRNLSDCLAVLEQREVEMSNQTGDPQMKLANLKNAEDTVRLFGTNALPALLEMINAHDSQAKVWLRSWAAKQSLIKFSFTPADMLRNRAALGYGALGPVAKVHVPGLLDNLAMAISSHERFCALKALTHVDPDPAVIIPALVKGAKDSDRSIRLLSTSALSQFNVPSGIGIPVFIEGLEDSIPLVRRSSANGLRRYGNEAKGALPALLRAQKAHPEDAAQIRIAINQITRQ